MGGVRATAGFRVMLKDFDDIKILLYKTNTFHVTVRLFSNRSQKTSKCGKNISDTRGYRLVCHFFLFLPHFDIICDLLLNRRTATWKFQVYMCKGVSFVCNGAMKNVMKLSTAECCNPRS